MLPVGSGVWGTLPLSQGAPGLEDQLSLNARTGQGHADTPAGRQDPAG